jgi:hypothetical protein
MIPNSIRDPKTIKIFSMKETKHDLQINGKYNKRNSASIIHNLDKIKAVQTIRNQIALKKMGVSDQ